MASASWTSSTDHVKAVRVVGLHAEDVGGAGVRKASSAFPKGTPQSMEVQQSVRSRGLPVKFEFLISSKYISSISLSQRVLGCPVFLFAPSGNLTR